MPPPVVNGDEAEIVFGARQEAVSIVNAAGDVVDPGYPAESNLGSGLGLIWSDAKHSWLVVGFNLG